MIRFRPGQQIKLFQIMRKTTNTDAKNRVTYGPHQEIGAFRGSLTAASQSEQTIWQQTNHPISHTVAVRGCCCVKAEDVIILNDRKFYVQGVSNPSELGIYTVIYCEERFGV